MVCSVGLSKADISELQFLLEIEPRALCVLSKHSTAELHLQTGLRFLDFSMVNNSLKQC